MIETYKKQTLYVLGTLLIALTMRSYINAYEKDTWFLEAFPVLLAIPILAFVYKTFPLTRLSYNLIFLHALILLVGAHYTYARVPLFDWLSDVFLLQRNHYDRLGHFFQGFVPAMVLREVFIRKQVIKNKAWLGVLIVCCCLAFSACYELLEWFTAIMSREGAESFLGTQGDAWDTQWDMFLALLGAILAQILLYARQNKQLKINEV